MKLIRQLAVAVQKNRSVVVAGKLTALGLVTAMAGCKTSSDKSAEETHKLNQDDICVAINKNKATHCQQGQKVAFVPNSWGNEQLPIVFAAINCDMRYSIAMNNGGVTCIYVGNKKEEAANTQQGSAAESSK